MAEVHCICIIHVHVYVTGRLFANLKLTSSSAGNDSSLIDTSVAHHVWWSKVTHDKWIFATLYSLDHLQREKERERGERERGGKEGAKMEVRGKVGKKRMNGGRKGERKEMRKGGKRCQKGRERGEETDRNGTRVSIKNQSSQHTCLITPLEFISGCKS